MTHYTVRTGDSVTVYSDTVDGTIFDGSLIEWARWKIQKDIDKPEIMTQVYDEETDPQEVIEQYEENDWFLEDTARVPNFCL